MLRLLRHVSTLQLALGLSIAVHAALLTVRFVAPAAFDRIFQDTPLEVILVNAKSQAAPDKAQAIAQASLAGGGNVEKGRASSPLPYSALTATGDETEDAQRQMDRLLQEQQQLLVQVRRRLAKMPAPDPRQVHQSAEGRAQEEKRQQLIRLLAEIEKRINEENARPRKRYISPATREAVYALYYDQLRRKVEDRGTRHFPEAGGKKLYGELVMILTVNHDGRVLSTEIVQSSGNRLLDGRAEAIARTAGPFGAFGPELRAKTDQLAVVARFKFTREQVLQTQIQEPQ
ncbi:MAG: energy transducer TonB [Comamonas sp. SCN 67-35]|uniref:energy transducer TonB n=1 Tax=unclassified Comamonas TaxID=2638500 RepID=UPI000869C1D4|nr:MULTISPECIES: TonB family protein [unclassified Comamonas]MBN9331311.1 TonB family protein [Comamonas sp.]ODU37044.1 MAG: energy transducer TonB [Comamonas sp. SCN 67-35]OJW99272.1 MAG: energy transducer TonB [Burkholderiales bacterium 66-26]